MEKSEKMYGIKVGDDHHVGLNGSITQAGGWDIFSKKEAKEFIEKCDLHVDKKNMKIVELW